MIRSSWTIEEGEVRPLGSRFRGRKRTGRAKQRAKIRQRVERTGSTTILGVK